MAAFPRGRSARNWAQLNECDRNPLNKKLSNKRVMNNIMDSGRTETACQIMLNDDEVSINTALEPSDDEDEKVSTRTALEPSDGELTDISFLDSDTESTHTLESEEEISKCSIC
uniref:Uncharacterized protein n=2 Tax=Caenorhabditis japonica TaxID=281687 RepID=A0A8R1E5K6_CAEJA